MSCCELLEPVILRRHSGQNQMASLFRTEAVGLIAGGEAYITQRSAMRQAF